MSDYEILDRNWGETYSRKVCSGESYCLTFVKQDCAFLYWFPIKANFAKMVYRPQGWWVSALISERTPSSPACPLPSEWLWSMLLLAGFQGAACASQWEVRGVQGAQAIRCQRSVDLRLRRAAPVIAQLSPTQRKETSSFAHHYTDPFYDGVKSCVMD